MCTVLGISLSCETDSALEEVLSRLSALIAEASIRGRHATGIAYWRDGRLFCYKSPLPADRFLSDFPLEAMVQTDLSIRCIVHTRYATTYGGAGEPQPIVIGSAAIALNGVVTQEPPQRWLELFGVQAETGNDAEIALQYYLQDRLEDTPGSWAVTILDKGRVLGFRNRYRPLWRLDVQRSEVCGYVYCSTYNILYRSGWLERGRIVRLPSSGDLIPETYRMGPAGRLREYRDGLVQVVS